MKKLLTFLLVASMIVAMFAVPAAAEEDYVNYQEEFKFIKTAPNINGEVKSGEYGTVPVHSFQDAKDQFIYGTKAGHEHDEYDESDWDVDFYAAWDADNLYMAWVVNTDVHVGMPEKDYDGNGSWSVDGDSNYMWQYSCLQFILTPGVPETGKSGYQTSEWSGNYLEVGLALTAEGTSVRAWWSKPANAPNLDVNEWDAAITRDDDEKITTYEVKIPWSKSGVDQIGNGAQFGLTYAVAAQEYETKRGMIEWQDGCLGGKKADNAAVITLTGNKDIELSENSHEGGGTNANKTEGTLPADAADAVQMIIDGVNVSITGEKAYLYTDPSKISENNNTWAACLLLAPVEGEEGYYEIVESKVGSGEPFSFDSEIEDGMIAYAAHSDGSGVGNARREAVMALGVGDKLGLFGINEDMTDTAYLNAMLYKPAAQGGETSGDTSDDTSDATSDATSEDDTSATTSEDDASTATSEDESAATSTTTSTTTSDDTSATTGDDEGGLGVWLWVIIGVVVLAAAAVVVVIVLKKKQ